MRLPLKQGDSPAGDEQFHGEAFPSSGEAQASILSIVKQEESRGKMRAKLFYKLQIYLETIKLLNWSVCVFVFRGKVKKYSQASLELLATKYPSASAC